MFNWTSLLHSKVSIQKHMWLWRHLYLWSHGGSESSWCGLHVIVTTTKNWKNYRVDSMTSEQLGKGIHEFCNCNCSDVYVAMPNGESNLLLTRCNVAHKTYSGLIDLWTFLVYTQPIHSKWHNWRCLLRECQQCGVHKLAM
jgi:hypothetical protein